MASNSKIERPFAFANMDRHQPRQLRHLHKHRPTHLRSRNIPTPAQQPTK
ncbi:MAG: hypothetical protein ACD_16C00208G0005, partial [uncultured bacterium]